MFSFSELNQFQGFKKTPPIISTNKNYIIWFTHSLNRDNYNKKKGCKSAIFNLYCIVFKLYMTYAGVSCKRSLLQWCNAFSRYNKAQNHRLESLSQAKKCRLLKIWHILTNCDFLLETISIQLLKQILEMPPLELFWSLQNGMAFGQSILPGQKMLFQAKLKLFRSNTGPDRY